MPITPDFSRRYGEHWQAIAKFAHANTNRLCCWCCKAPSVEVHHVRYKDGRGAIRDREIPGRDIFPVCGDCHNEIHSPDHWIKDKLDPVLGHHNQLKTVQQLQQNFRSLVHESAANNPSLRRKKPRPARKR